VQFSEGIHFIFLRLASKGLFFVLTTRHNVSPALYLSLLERITKIFKDYCGVVSEESIRKNFVMLYEILDEIIVISPSNSPWKSLRNRLGNRFDCSLKSCRISVLSLKLQQKV
jgi:AP-4 complex subunit mu-1